MNSAKFYDEVAIYFGRFSGWNGIGRLGVFSESATCHLYFLGNTAKVDLQLH
jgi:hypothetical protein